MIDFQVGEICVIPSQKMSNGSKEESGEFVPVEDEKLVPLSQDTTVYDNSVYDTAGSSGDECAAQSSGLQEHMSRMPSMVSDVAKGRSAIYELSSNAWTRWQWPEWALEAGGIVRLPYNRWRPRWGYA